MKHKSIAAFLGIIMLTLSGFSQTKKSDYPSKKKAEKQTQKLRNEGLELAQRYLYEGDTHFNNKEYQKAITSYTKGCEINPISDVRHFGNRNSNAFSNPPFYPLIGELLTARGLAYYRLRSYNDASRDFSKARQRMYKSFLLFVAQAETFKALGNYNDAYNSYTYALQLEPENPQLNYAQGVTAYYSSILTMNYRFPGAIRESMRRNGNTLFNSSIHLLGKAIELQPIYGEAYAGRALAYLEAGDNGNASLDINKAIEIMPFHAEAHFIKGVIQMRGYGNQEEAIKAISEAIKIDPQNSKYQATLDKWNRSKVSVDYGASILKSIAALVIIAACNQSEDQSRSDHYDQLYQKNIKRQKKEYDRNKRSWENTYQGWGVNGI